MALDRIGDLLKREREKRGDDLQQIADYLCIRRIFLEALENSRYDELPADAYVIGFLRSYALFLGLDGNEAIDRYRKEMTGRRRRPELSVPMPITEGRTPSAAILVAAAVAALVIYAIWYALSSSDRTEINAAAPPPVNAAMSETAAPDTTTLAAAPSSTMATPPVSAPSASTLTATPLAALGESSTMAAALAAPPAAAASAIATPTQAATPPASLPSDQTAKAEPEPHTFGETTNSRIAIRTEKESWILVTDEKGHTIFDRVLKPGDVYHAPMTEGLSLTVGNSNGVIISVDGKDLPKLGAKASVMRGIALNPDTLKSGDLTPQE
jgi:cytoskeletal protein RodZ